MILSADGRPRRSRAASGGGRVTCCTTDLLLQAPLGGVCGVPIAAHLGRLRQGGDASRRAGTGALSDGSNNVLPRTVTRSAMPGDCTTRCSAQSDGHIPGVDMHSPLAHRFVANLAFYGKLYPSHRPLSASRQVGVRVLDERPRAGIARYPPRYSCGALTMPISKPRSRLRRPAGELSGEADTDNIAIPRLKPQSGTSAAAGRYASGTDEGEHGDHHLL